MNYTLLTIPADKKKILLSPFSLCNWIEQITNFYTILAKEGIRCNSSSMKPFIIQFNSISLVVTKSKCVFGNDYLTWIPVSPYVRQFKYAEISLSNFKHTCVRWYRIKYQPRFKHRDTMFLLWNQDSGQQLVQLIRVKLISQYMTSILVLCKNFVNT